ncbi:Cyclic nucleotide-binding protein [Pseudocohnilembus persalinus]|uniref:Cyclic nucleotide-binding protein n=1 Tax=Pseudocohnilembus persalinus TaxID=266149 RepID=A0A0V0Q9P5_PSEPJ|nr:Cyclic nucleotide-binding protein [Pseudocohnilembus persalinus]|eukprot:KRW98950.1 Cyclic nucleotide-binding protein [Pseudocohnilembus persalinus]
MNENTSNFLQQNPKTLTKSNSYYKKNFDLHDPNDKKNSEFLQQNNQKYNKNNNNNNYNLQKNTNLIVNVNGESLSSFREGGQSYRQHLLQNLDSTTNNPLYELQERQSHRQPSFIDSDQYRSPGKKNYYSKKNSNNLDTFITDIFAQIPLIVAYFINENSSYTLITTSFLLEFLIFMKWFSLKNVYQRLERVMTENEKIADCYFNEEKTWLHTQPQDLPYLYIDSHWTTVYIAAYYWAVCTMVTILIYIPLTSAEQIGSVLANLVCAGCFGYALSTIGTILNDINKKNGQFKAERTRINRFIKKNNISQQLKERIQLYLDYLHEQERDKDIMEEELVIKRLSEHLKREVALEMYKDVITKFQILLQNFSYDTIQESMLNLQLETYSPGAIIIQQEELEKQKQEGFPIYYIENGEIEIYFTRNKKKFVISTLKAGSLFGIYDFFTGQESQLSYECKHSCSLYKIRRDQFLQIIESQDKTDDFESFMMIKTDMLFRRIGNEINYIDSQNILRCDICSDPQHFTYICPKVMNIPNIKKIIYDYNHLGTQLRIKYERSDIRTINVLNNIIDIQDAAAEVFENDLNEELVDAALQWRELYLNMIDNEALEEISQDQQRTLDIPKFQNNNFQKTKQYPKNEKIEISEVIENSDSDTKSDFSLYQEKFIQKKLKQNPNKNMKIITNQKQNLEHHSDKNSNISSSQSSISASQQEQQQNLYKNKNQLNEQKEEDQESSIQVESSQEFIKNDLLSKNKYSFQQDLNKKHVIQSTLNENYILADPFKSQQENDSIVKQQQIFEQKQIILAKKLNNSTQQQKQCQNLNYEKEINQVDKSQNRKNSNRRITLIRKESRLENQNEQSFQINSNNQNNSRRASKNSTFLANQRKDKKKSILGNIQINYANRKSIQDEQSIASSTNINNSKKHISFIYKPPGIQDAMDLSSAAQLKRLSNNLNQNLQQQFTQEQIQQGNQKKNKKSNENSGISESLKMFNNLNQENQKNQEKNQNSLPPNNTNLKIETIINRQILEGESPNQEWDLKNMDKLKEFNKFYPKHNLTKVLKQIKVSHPKLRKEDSIKNLKNPNDIVSKAEHLKEQIRLRSIANLSQINPFSRKMSKIGDQHNKTYIENSLNSPFKNPRLSRQKNSLYSQQPEFNLENEISNNSHINNNYMNNSNNNNKNNDKLRNSMSVNNISALKKVNGILNDQIMATSFLFTYSQKK